MLKFRSKRLADAAACLQTSTKYDFQIKLGRYTLRIDAHADVVEGLLDCLFIDRMFLRTHRSGNTLMIVDEDIRLNVRFAQIMAGQTPTVDEGDLTPVLVATA